MFVFGLYLRQWLRKGSNVDRDRQLAIMRRRPCVIQLCKGAYLQEPVKLTPTIQAFPLKPMGAIGDADYLVAFGREVLDSPKLNAAVLAKPIAESAEDNPVVALICRPRIHVPDRDSLWRLASKAFDRARTILSLVTGNPIEAFAFVNALKSPDNYGFLRWPLPKRTRLGFGNTGADFAGMCMRLDARFEAGDETFEFAIKTHAETTREKNSRFAIARHFALLEGLARRLKGNEKGSLDAVRKLLGGGDVGVIKGTVAGKECEVDVLRLALELRNKLFHGVELRREKLSAKYRDSFDLLDSDEGLSTIRRTIGGLCELELMRWANGKSKGQEHESVAAEGSAEKGEAPRYS